MKDIILVIGTIGVMSIIYFWPNRNVGEIAVLPSLVIKGEAELNCSLIGIDGKNRRIERHIENADRLTYQEGKEIEQQIMWMLTN